MISWAEWLQNMALATAIRESTLAYPVILSLHLTGMALFGGMILMTDLRLLGIAMTRRPVSEVIQGLRPWKHLGLTLVVTCGMLLAWSKLASYAVNPFFHLKLTLLLLVAIHALVFRKSVYRNAKELDQSPVIPGRAKVAAVISLALWIGLVSAGRWIGYWEPKEETKAAQLIN